jgi:hypothetical protein
MLTASKGNEDGERVCECYGLIGCAILTALNALDLAGELKADSKFQDLALVISFFLAWSDGLESYGVEEDGNGDADGEWYEALGKNELEGTEEFDWRKQVVSYAKKAGVDPAKGVSSTAEMFENYTKDADTKVPKQGRWRWAPRVSDIVNDNISPS